LSRKRTITGDGCFGIILDVFTAAMKSVQLSQFSLLALRAGADGSCARDAKRSIKGPASTLAQSVKTVCMAEEHHPVLLQVADRHNLVAGSHEYRWSKVNSEFSGIESAVNYLSFNYDELQFSSRVFRVVDSSGAVLMQDAEIRGRVRKR
jgi:hypothetical protein